MKAFRYKDYRPDSRETTLILPAMRDSLIPIDLLKDFKYAINYIYCRILNKPFSKLPPNDRPSPKVEKGIWDYFSMLFKREDKQEENEVFKGKDKREENEGNVFDFGSFQIIVKKRNDGK